MLRYRQGKDKLKENQKPNMEVTHRLIIIFFSDCKLDQEEEAEKEKEEERGRGRCEKWRMRRRRRRRSLIHFVKGY